MDFLGVKILTVNSCGR